MKEGKERKETKRKEKKRHEKRRKTARRQAGKQAGKQASKQGRKKERRERERQRYTHLERERVRDRSSTWIVSVKVPTCYQSNTREMPGILNLPFPTLTWSTKLEARDCRTHVSAVLSAQKCYFKTSEW